MRCLDALPAMTGDIWPLASLLYGVQAGGHSASLPGFIKTRQKRMTDDAAPHSIYGVFLQLCAKTLVLFAQQRFRPCPDN